MKLVPRSFYNRSSLQVAPELLGKILIRKFSNQIISGRIVETEAYLAFGDAASHAFKGKTKRNASLFKKAGHAYVHSIHMQQCLDIVTDSEDTPSSVLIRALEPLEGITIMRSLRNKEKITELTSGPGKLTQALNISKNFDGADVTTTTSNLYVISDGYQVSSIVAKKRIGISKATEFDYRFYVQDSTFVSKK